MKARIITLMCAAALLSSCHIYQKYERPDDLVTQGLYRDLSEDSSVDELNFGDVPWRQVFTDPQLQALIEEALHNNADIRSAALTVEQAQAQLTAARLAYLPLFQLSPQGTLTKVEGRDWTKAWSANLSGQWQIDLFASLLNSNRNAKVTYQQSKYYQQAVQTQIISSVANLYYTLLMLDRNLEISTDMSKLLERTTETMQEMTNLSYANAASVEQARAGYMQVVASLSDLRQNIREMENTLCLLLNKPGQAIPRGRLEDQHLPTQFNTGVSLQLLSNRPDVQAAEMALAANYYNTNQARAAFYPQVTINGQAGWTNNLGVISNPAQFLASIVGSITQPLFYRGRLVAALKAAKANEEKSKLQFQTTLLNAGNEVSNALFEYETCQEKAAAREMQVTSARNASEYTAELFQLGTASYLEVLSAQNSYLSAQLAQVSDTFEEMQAVISLYKALGGGREIEN